MVEDNIIRTLITPDGKTINKVFSENQRYYIDIYQRDYKWDKLQVETLLRDIEIKFNLTELKILDPKKIKENVLNHFKPYFLNTFLTCKESNNISIVDGQQRLTTLLIMLIKLRQLLNTINNSDEYPVKSINVNVLDKLIFEADEFNDPEYYKIYNPNRQGAFNKILKGDEFEPLEETQKKIIENYEIISKYYDSFFKKDNLIDVNKLTHYIFYILEKLNIVEIKIEDQENVSTIFEVVNDRGLGLKPYEILKGKFIGSLPLKLKEEANKIWVDLQNKYYNAEISNSTENKIDLDSFFKMYFRARFSESESEYKKFEDKYHYEIYQNKKILDFFNKFENPDELYNWVVTEFKYYAELHFYIRTTYENEYLIYNKLLDQNQQYLLIMSSIILNDSEKDTKINLVAKKLDQLHTTLRLLDEYESNMFQDIIQKLNTQIRNKKLDEIEQVFDSVLISYLEEKGIFTKGIYKKISDLYKYELLENMKNKWLNFSKYVLMRVDRYLSKQLDKPSYCGEELNELENRFNKNNLKRYGMHLEHIYADNDKNIKLFTNEQGIFDEAKFKETRNKLGVVLLLKDKQNISSNNDYYDKKIEDYATSNLIWNELLVGHIDSIDVKNLPNNLTFTKIEPAETKVFPLDKVEVRQKELFEIIKVIWGF